MPPAGVVGPGVIGWLDVKKFEQTKDERTSQGWTPVILDTNGDGKRGEHVAHDQALDPRRTAVMLNHYRWRSRPTTLDLATVLGYRARYPRGAGADPANTALTEVYEPPLPGYARGGDVDTDCVFWVALSSGHLASSTPQVQVTKGPTRRKHCPRAGHCTVPRPQLRDVKDRERRDQLLRLGRLVKRARPRRTADRDGQRLGLDHAVRRRQVAPCGCRIRRPVPENVDGRIDDEGAGWKGPGSDHVRFRTNFHLEGSKGQYPKAIKLQLRPDPWRGSRRIPGSRATTRG